MAVKNRVNLQTTIDDNLPNNAAGSITPELHREVETDLNDSTYNKITDAGLVGLKIYDPTRNYTTNEATVYNAGAGLQVWLSNKPTTGSFIPADWDLTEGAVNEAPTDSRAYVRYNGAWEDLFAALPTQNINTLSDLPTPVGGVITLDEGVKYNFTALVNIGVNEILAATQNTLTASSFAFGIQSDKGSGAVVTVPANASFFASEVSIIGVGMTGVKTVDTNNFFIDACNLIGGSVGIEVNNVTNSFIKDNYFEGNSTCILSSGNNIGYTLLEGNYFNAYLSKGVDLGTSITSSLLLSNNLFEGTSNSYYVSGVANSANIGKRARYVLNNFNGLGIGLENITEKDLKHEFIYNDGNAANSSDYGRIYFANNGLITNITAINTPVAINGTFTLADSSRFEQSTNGVLKYTGNYSNPHEVTFKVLAEKVGGGGVSTYLFVLSRNGNPISESATTVTTAQGSPISGSVDFFVNANTGDEFELFVENITGAEDLTVIECSVLSKRLS